MRLCTGWKLTVLLAGAAAFLACGDLAPRTQQSEPVESHQTSTEVHHEPMTSDNPGTGGSGTGCQHDPNAANPCADSFIVLPKQPR